MKIISPKVHGIIDYLVVVFLLASPLIFGFTWRVDLVTYALYVVRLVLKLFTNYTPGFIKSAIRPVKPKINGEYSKNTTTM